MDIITGYVGSPHVTAEQDRDINIGIFGAESYVLRTGSQLKAEVSSNNEIKIRDGVIMHQGCAASIKKNTYDSLTIVNGSQGMKRIDLVVARYSRNQSTKVESLTLKVIQGTPVTGTPSAPGYTTGDIQAGDLVADMPLYQVVINGLNITAVKQVFNTVDTVAELNGKSYELIKVSDNRYVKKYADGRFEAYGHVAIKDLVFANQIGTSGVYYAQYQNLNIGITAKTISYVQHTANNSGVVWTGNASVSGIDMKGTILQYGSTSRSTDINYDVKGTWK